MIFCILTLCEMNAEKRTSLVLLYYIKSVEIFQKGLARPIELVFN